MRQISVKKKRILILGGGFGGVYVAVHLGKMLSKSELEETEIALVNRENYIVFQPLLPEVISGSVELNHVIAPIRRMAPQANLYTRDIESIDPVARTVTLSPGVRPTPLTLSYDHLVIAMGTRLDYSKIPGMREHASPFKYLGDALYLRNQLVRMLEEAEAESDPECRKSLLTFVVAGGGFSGVECVACQSRLASSSGYRWHADTSRTPPASYGGSRSCKWTKCGYQTQAGRSPNKVACRPFGSTRSS